MRVLLILLLLVSQHGMAQKYAQKLHVKSGEIFQLKGKHFEIDSLLLDDGAELRLDKSFRSTEIIVGYLQTGIDCIINGEGLPGKHGEMNSPTRIRNFFGFVTRTDKPENGMPGTDACHLMLLVKRIKVSGRFAINLRGGDGGNGASKAGLGGDGGNFIFSLPKNGRETILSNLALFNQGGYGGQFLVVRKNSTSNFASDGAPGITEYIDLANQ